VAEEAGILDKVISRVEWTGHEDYIYRILKDLEQSREGQRLARRIRSRERRSYDGD